MTRYLIIGGVAGGATAAARLRRNDETAEIVIVERGEHISYANCGLPYYLGGVITERVNLFVQTPESFSARFNVTVLTRHEAVAIDRAAKTVDVVNRVTGERRTERYNKLLLAPGAEPVRPHIPGIDLPGIFTLRSVSDTDRIAAFLREKAPRRAVVIGAGFIGLEMAENLHRRGIHTTIVEAADQVMTPLDYEMAALVHQHLKTKKVAFYLKDGVSAFARQHDTLTVTLASGRTLSADLVILSIGVRPDSRLAREAGLAIGPAGGIVVDEYLRTSDPAIWAVGDAIEFPHPITGKLTPVYLAGPANKQARIAADTMVFGPRTPYRGSVATAIAKVFDLTVGSTGFSEKALRAAGIPHRSVIVHGSSHAGYYPDALPLTVKIVFAPDTGRLLGAQVIGYEGADKRLDILSAVVQRGGTVDDLGEFEHAYAPPYSSAKDPVNIAGFAAQNLRAGMTDVISWEELFHADRSRIVIIDVRTPEEYALGTIEGAVNIPLDTLRSRLSEIPRDREAVVFCGVGLRGYLASRILRQNGFPQARNLSGGYKIWEHAVQKQSNEDIFAHDRIGVDDLITRTTPTAIPTGPALTIDACGLQCPGPIMRLKQEVDRAPDGARLTVTASDPGFSRDVEAWCRVTGNRLVSLGEEKGKITAVVEIHRADRVAAAPAISGGTDKTIVVFSADLDRALAAFVIANGAAAMGRKVTLFFTFWGLSIIKKRRPPRIAKDLLGRMFGWMLPSSSHGLGLSKLNFFGLGPILMRYRMRAKQVASLEEMIEAAKQNGVHLVACQMSMDVMGVDASELIEGVTIGGVATYLERAEQADTNLFI